MKYFLTYFLPISPFLTEIITDWIRIYIQLKPDWFRLKHRVGMIIGVALIFVILSTERNFKDVDKFLILAVLPYVFFDYVLNKMRGLKWYYLSASNGKYWDETLHKFNPYALLSVRVLVAAILIGLMIWL